jgi:hypothetical protein
MPVIQLEAQLPVDKLLSAVKQLSEPELERFALDVNALVAKRKAPSLAHHEAKLLLKINEGVPAALQQRYNELIAERQAETLAEDEYAELLRLTQQVEQIEVARVEHLAELARLRGISLTALMENLGITAPAYG